MLTDEQKKAEREWIERWWLHVAGPARWDDLNHDQKVSISGWLLLTLVFQPESGDIPKRVLSPHKSEDMPTEYSAIIQDLSLSIDRIKGESRKRYKFVQARNPLDRAYYDGAPALVHGKARQVKVRKKRSGLAT